MDVRRNEAMHRYEVGTGVGTAVLEYSEPRPGVVDLQHTYVPLAARRKGFADLLARTALDDARRRGQRVIATCPYVASFIGRHPEYRPLLGA